MWNSFDRITWSFQNRLRVTYSIEPTSDEGDGLDPDDAEDQRQQLPVPLDLAQQAVSNRERDQEEADVLQPLREVIRVEGLQRVQNDDRGEDPRQPDGSAGRRGLARKGRPAGGAAPFSASPPCHPPADELQSEKHGDHAAGDHQVERDEEVRGVAAGVQRDAEGKRGDDRERQQDRPAAEGVGEDADRGDGERSQQGDDAGRVVAQVDDLVGVPLVAEDQDREEDERQEHRRRAGAAGGEQDRGGAGAGGDEDAGAREDVAQGEGLPRLPAGRLPAGGRDAVQADRPGGTRLRSWPSSLTRSL